jgi:hypothetical protein
LTSFSVSPSHAIPGRTASKEGVGHAALQAIHPQDDAAVPNASFRLTARNAAVVAR